MSSTLFKTGSLAVPGACSARLTDWPANPKNHPVSVSAELI